MSDNKIKIWDEIRKSRHNFSSFEEHGFAQDLFSQIYDDYIQDLEQKIEKMKDKVEKLKRLVLSALPDITNNDLLDDISQTLKELGERE